MANKETKPEHYVNILEVEVSEIEKKSTGQPWIDEILDEGYVVGSAYMVSGQPGCGKSTLLQQVADHITSEGGIAVYSNVEQSLKQIVAYAKRLDLKSGFIIAQHPHEDALCEQLISIRDDNPDANIICVVDSVSHMASRSIVRSKEIMRLLVQIGQSFNITMFFIVHETKSASYVGGSDTLHLVDAYFQLEHLDKNKGTVSATVVKNRYGPSGVRGVGQMIDGMFINE